MVSDKRNSKLRRCNPSRRSALPEDKDRAVWACYAARRIAIYLRFHGHGDVERRAIFHPSLERGRDRLAKTVPSRTSAAMLYTRDPVEAGEIPGFLTHLRDYLAVVDYCAERGNRGIALSVIKNQLPAPVL